MGWYTRFSNTKATAETVVWGSVYLFLLILLCYNIVLSQTVSEKYSLLVYNEKATIGSVLKDVRQLPQFGKLFILYKNKYGTKIDQEVFFEERKNEEIIASIKNLLKQTPESRDLNYNLAQLMMRTNKDGSLYEKKALEIDPGLKQINNLNE